MDALDTFISQRRMEPQLAIKIIEHFDRCMEEVLREKVKARMTFKVCFGLHFDLTENEFHADTRAIGPARYLPVLRRSLDFHHQRRQHEARKLRQPQSRQNQDCRHELQEAR